MDLRLGYYQVRIVEGDEAKITCVMRYGSFEFFVMPFGLTNALATFCNLMNDVLSEYVNDFVIVYLDDIIVYSESLRERVNHLRKALQKIREHSLFLKPEKCAFDQQEIDFLSLIIEHGDVKMDPKKIVAITNWEELKKVAVLRSFLGLANYYMKFINGYSNIVVPLIDLLKKDQA